MTRRKRQRWKVRCAVAALPLLVAERSAPTGRKRLKPIDDVLAPVRALARQLSSAAPPRCEKHCFAAAAQPGALRVGRSS
jgi:hypothetical protein